MVGRIAFPHSDEKPVVAHAQSAEDSQRPPSYSDADQPAVSQAAYILETTTTVTTTTHFFSLPLWWRRGPPTVASAMSDDPHASHDRRTARSRSYNIDKELPAVPRYEDVVSTALNFPDAARGVDSDVLRAGPSRASTLMPPQAQPARTLAQAGLGIGLPHATPLVAVSTPKASSATSRPSTAPRPTRLQSSPEIRRVKSLSRTQGERSLPNLSESSEKLRIRKMSATLSTPKENEAWCDAEEVSDPSDARPEPRLVKRRASFWNRRRVQSLKDPPAESARVLGQYAQQSPIPSLPVLNPVSPMFPDRYLQPSPGSTPQYPKFQPAVGLRRRHSERGASLSSSRHSPPIDSNFISDPPPIPKRSPLGPPRPVGDRLPDSPAPNSGASSSTQDLTQRRVAMSFVSSPAIARFPSVDERNYRPRSMTNPSNLLHRLSMGIFNLSTPSSPISSPTVSTNIINDSPLSSSPRHSTALPRSSLSKSNVAIPKPRADEESPEVFLGRLEEAVSKAEIANVLAGSGDAFYSQALQLYIDRFDFKNNPLDVALRKLLMDVGLPKETQQIDRVMEAFAASYAKDNPGLFAEDHPYILAFSLIMLHTDAFNKSNKRKMTKADYIKNTKLVGVPTEVLDYFFDNIVFAPFIFIEDPVDINGQRGLTQDVKAHPSTNGQAASTANSSGLSMLGKSNKIDPYYLISRNFLGHLRIDVESHIPLRNPFCYQGTAGSWNEAELRRSFARADVIEVDTMDPRKMSTLPFFSMNTNGAPGPMITSFASPIVSEPESTLWGDSTLKVTKVGLLNRKEDLLDGGKRAMSRKWREWSVVLTGSQLLVFRDSAVALDFIAQAQSSGNGMFSTQPSFLRPDELLSVKDAIAVYDSSYVKHENVLRLVMPSGRQFLLQAESELQRNEWIAHINYASTFKTAGIRMRPVSATEDTRMNASSYTHDVSSDLDDSSSGLVFEGEGKDPGPTSLGSASATGIALRVHIPSPDESSSTQSRSRIVLSKIREFESKIKTTRTQLDSDIGVVRNLAILTPFQRSTRDRLQASVINLGKHIKQLRLEIVKTTCYRDVLAADLASEEREWRRCRKDALEFKERHRRRKNSPIPRMTLSVHEDEPMHEDSSRSLSRSDVSELSHGRAESSICESFHSALDFGSDWPLSARLSASPQSRATPSFEISSPLAYSINEEAPGNLLMSSFFHPASPVRSVHTPSSSAVDSSRNPDESSFAGEEPRRPESAKVNLDNAEEQAEEWNKTRAARRVSLVRTPMGLKVTARLDKEGRRRSMCSEED